MRKEPASFLPNLAKRKWVPFLFLPLFLASCCNPFSSSKLALDPDSFPDGQVGVPYAVTIAVTNADTPLGDVQPVDPLPPGLSLSWEKWQRHFSVAGTPSTADDYRFRLYGYSYGTMCAGKQLERSFSLRVAPARP